jgi:hypothetical protein
MDSSPRARLRAGQRWAWAGNGSGHRAGRAVRAHRVAARTRVVRMGGGRGGRVRRTRLGASGHAAVARRCAARPPATGQRLRGGEAGLAPQEPWAATAQAALLGRWRLKPPRRWAPAPPRGHPGRPPVQGAGWPPGRDPPAVVPDGERPRPGAAGTIRRRRWRPRPSAACPEPSWEGVRMAAPASAVPLRGGSPARAGRREAWGAGSPPRGPVATHFFVAPAPAAMEMPRAWMQTALERRSRLARLVGPR